MGRSHLGVLEYEVARALDTSEWKKCVSGCVMCGSVKC